MDVSVIEAYMLANLGFLTSFTETNDLTAAVTWANVPEANVPTHTGDVIGDTGLVIDPTAISGKALVTAVSTDMVLIWDATDSALKRADFDDFAGGGVTSISDLSDVDTTGVSADDLLVFGASAWEDTGGALTFSGAVLSTTGNIEAVGHGTNIFEGEAHFRDDGGTDWLAIFHNGTNIIFDCVNAIGIRIENPLGGSMIVLKDTGDVGNAALAWLQYEDSNGSRMGFVGYGSGADGNLSVINDVHGGNITFFAENAAGTNIALADFDPDGPSVIVPFGVSLNLASYLQPATSTDTALNDVTSTINTAAGKIQGAMVYNTTTNNPVYAVGSADGSVWVDGAGTTVNTPVTP